MNSLSVPPYIGTGIEILQLELSTLYKAVRQIVTMSRLK